MKTKKNIKKKNDRKKQQRKMKPMVFIHRMEQQNAREMIQKEGRKRQTQVENRGDAKSG